jgi:phosphoribosylanthranilate isomerase
MVRVKICGITNYEDAALAVGLGADALGFIFASSPRKAVAETVRRIVRTLPPFVQSVGVFLNAEAETVEETVRFCGLDLIQLHGEQSPEFCARFMPRVVKALGIKDGASLDRIPAYRGHVRAVLLDTYTETAEGGTGTTFDWNLACRANASGIPVILAGGLKPSNIVQAISRAKPFAVDIGSGVEAHPGKKDPVLMKELMHKITSTLQGGFLNA